MATTTSELPTNPVADRQIFSVSQLNRRARQLLETHLSLLWVEGELSNIARPSSGHWYFTLKDENAQIRCAMFRNRNREINFSPDNGQQILVRGRISLYENRGDYQLIAEHIEPAGRGALQLRYEQLKNKLAAEGLFDTATKRPIAKLPRHLGIITSPTGAALRDIIHVLKRRFPILPITIYATPVQGSTATPGILAALALANDRRECDVLILARGGGSLEDLWPFNEEAVARAIYASDIPIISGVGHETDTTIADFVADARAPTPSAAAELASPDGQELASLLQGYINRLVQKITAELTQKGRALRNSRLRLRNPREILEKQGQHLDHLEIRLAQSMHLYIHARQLYFEQLLNRYRGQAPQAKLTRLGERTTYLRERLTSAINILLTQKNQALAATSGLMQAVSPLNTLERGYVIAQNQAQKVITHTSDTKEQEQIVITVVDGLIDCEVRTIRPLKEDSNGEQENF